MIFTFSQKAMSDSHDKETEQKKVDNTATVNEEPLPLNDPFAGDASTASDIVTEETPTSSAVKLRAYKLVGSFSAKDNSFITLVDDNGEFMMDVISIFYTGGDDEVQQVVKGLPVETIGQAMPETMRNEAGNRIRIFRLMMNCCIADARPISIPVEFDQSIPNYKEMGWYKVHGVMGYENWDEFTIPVLKATKLVPTAEPEQSAFGQRQ